MTDAATPTPAPPAVSPWAAAAAGWALPGLGYWLVGERRRAVVAGATVSALFVVGLLIGGVRVIDVPGYADGRRDLAPDGRWSLTSSPVGAVLARPWYLGQVFVGPANLAASYASLSAASAGYPKPTARLGEIGTLYTSVAGMLNLLVILDAFGRASPVRP